VRVPCKITGKNMKIPAGRYVSLKPQCREIFSWYGERGKRRYRKEGRVWVNKEIVEHFFFLRNFSKILLSLHNI
jgi:hypothetical protein